MHGHMLGATGAVEGIVCVKTIKIIAIASKVSVSVPIWFGFINNAGFVDNSVELWNSALFFYAFLGHEFNYLIHCTLNEKSPLVEHLMGFYGLAI